MNPRASQTWLILGASSSIGRALAHAVARQGDDVLLAGRDEEDLRRTAADIEHRYARHAAVLSFDAGDPATHAAFAATAAQTSGVLNVAWLIATMPPQAQMDSSPADAVACIETSFTGAVSVLHHLAPYLEARGSGVVVGFGSVAGDRGRVKNYVYGSAKAGLHTYLAGLRNRLGRSGVHVMTVKPGFVDTSMTWGQPGLFLVADPESVAAACVRGAARRRNVIYVPWFWRWIMVIIRSIPEALFKKLTI